ncbi:hypothetical protein FHS60_000083 [Alloprevotella rava]|uniref:Uncharacterized protein n=1 Tax=Alloprevotella rava TaxID=671218 RepID=A0A7W5UFU0_9BACT|nr:hypothetical protein [Alloprevotella rava]
MEIFQVFCILTVDIIKKNTVYIVRLFHTGLICLNSNIKTIKFLVSIAQEKDCMFDYEKEKFQ